MKTENLLSASILLKSLGKVLIHVSLIYENKNVKYVSSNELKDKIESVWSAFSDITDIFVSIYPSYISEGVFTISVNATSQPMAIVSVEFNLNS